MKVQAVSPLDRIGKLSVDDLGAACPLQPDPGKQYWVIAAKAIGRQSKNCDTPHAVYLKSVMLNASFFVISALN